MANSFTLFADVKAWRCPNTFEVRLLHFLGGEEHVRKVSELMSLDMFNQEHNHRQYIRVQCVMLTLRLKSYGKELKIVLATNINPKIVGGRLVLKATSGTHIYFDSETAAGKEEFDKLTGDGTDQTASSLKLVDTELPRSLAEIVGNTYTFQLKLKDFNFTSKHQTFTISGVFPSRELAPAPVFVVNEGAQVPEASQPEVVTTGSDVKVDNTC
ncbi:BnaAnng41410D, partial [Brassica napus]